MAVNDQAVRVAGTGEVSFAPTGTSAPTDATTALPGTWKATGYTTPDGVEFTFGRESTDIDAWQGTAVRSVITRAPAQVAFTLIETKTDNLVLAFGGGTVIASGGVSTFTPPDDAENNERSLVVDMTDGTKKFRYWFSRVQVEGDIKFTFKDGVAVEYPITLKVLAASPRWKLFSNDTTNLTTGS